MKNKIKLLLIIAVLLVINYLTISLWQNTFNPLLWSDDVRFCICLATIISSVFMLAFAIAEYYHLYILEYHNQ